MKGSIAMPTLDPLRALTSEQLQQYYRDGYFVARGLFSADEAKRIGDTFMELGKNGPVEGISEIKHGAQPTYSDADPLAKYPRMLHPHRHPEMIVGEIAMKYMLDARVHTILHDLFGEESVAAQSMFYFKPPGARGQDLHQDNFYLRVSPGSCMAAWTAIDDTDESNGGLFVVPGTHTLDVQCPTHSNSDLFFTNEHVEPPAGKQPIPVRLRAGDVLFFNGSVIHGSFPNESKDRFRRAFICHYVPATSAETAHWYRPLLTFDGQEVQIPEATGGGPCGTIPVTAAVLH